MRPWPKELLNVIPLPPQRGSALLEAIGGPEGVIAARPWWRRELCMGPEHDMYRWGDETGSPPIGRASVLEYQFRRTDGTVLRGYDPEPLTAWDLEHPIPHPGFRTGQVWAFPHEAWLDSKTPYSIFRMVTVLSADVDGQAQEVCRVEFSEGIPLYGTTTERIFRWSQMQRVKTMEGYLIADPCCPWLAPWSASAPKEKEKAP